MARRRRRQRRLVTTIGFLFLILLAGLVCYLVWDSYFRDKTNEGESEESKTEQVIEDKTKKEEGSKEQPEEEDKTEEEVEDEKEQPSYDGENPNQSSALTGVITRAENMGEQVVIRVNIDQYLGEGECRLNMKEDDEAIYSDTANIVGSAATATCEGFDVPVAEIGNGNFVIEITVNSGDKTGIISGEVSI